MYGYPRSVLPRLAGLVLAASLVLPASAGASLEPAAGGERFVPGEVIVRFEPGAAAAERRAVRARAGVELDRTLELPRAQVVDVDGGVAAAVRRLERAPAVAYAQPNFRYEALAPPPDDTFFGQLWGLAETPGVGALTAWDSNRGAGAVIAVADTGVDLTHPDIAPNLWSNPADPANGADDDGNGFVDDVHGADFVDDDADPDDYQYHGTHVAGTAAAVDANALGIAGVAPDARIMAVRVLDGDGSGTTGTIADGIAYAAREGAHVINLSLGGPSDEVDPFLNDAVNVARQLNAVVTVAAGNSGTNNDLEPVMPCNLPQGNLICVAAVDESGGLAGFSNYGTTHVDVGAPGVGILSTKTDYGAHFFTESFEGPLDDWSGDVPPFGVSSVASAGTQSLADSPPGNYGDDEDALIQRTNPISLAGRRGCRMHFDMQYDLEAGFDFLFAGALGGGTADSNGFTGSSQGGFEAAEASISRLDGLTVVRPAFQMATDENITDDGVHIDRLRLFCRDTTYTDATTPLDDYDGPMAGNYVEFDGTSMAAPHVAGVAALVRAADPGAPGEQIVQAIKQSAAPLASLKPFTSSGGVADANAAIAAAIALPNTATPPPPPPPPPPPGPAGPNAANLRDAKSRVRVSRKGVFTYPVRAATGLTGTATFRTRRKVTASRKVHLTIARKSFRIVRGGSATLRVKLSRKELRLLRRNRRFLLRVTVTVRDGSGLSATAGKRLTLLPPKRR